MDLTTIAYHLGTTTRHVRETAQALGYPLTHTPKGWITTSNPVALIHALTN